MREDKGCMEQGKKEREREREGESEKGERGREREREGVRRDFPTGVLIRGTRLHASDLHCFFVFSRLSLIPLLKHTSRVGA